MDASRRLTTWLRLACALVLAAGLSSAAATATATATPAAHDIPALVHTTLTGAPGHSVAIRAAAAVRHVAGKHRSPVMAGAIGAIAIVAAGLTGFVARRRRTGHPLRHLALSRGARAPPSSVAVHVL